MLSVQMVSDFYHKNTQSSKHIVCECVSSSPHFQANWLLQEEGETHNLRCTLYHLQHDSDGHGNYREDA